MLQTKTYALGSLTNYKYVVVLSSYQGKILLSRHRRRNTWETQGGHIEAHEQPLDAAKRELYEETGFGGGEWRELYEESGAVDFDIAPLCDYWAGVEGTSDWANGMVFRATIRRLAPLPESEMAEVRTFDALPDNLTYPQITPVLFDYLAAHAEA